MNQYPAWGVDVTAVSVRGAKIALSDDGTPRLVAWDVIDYAEEVDDLHALSRLGVIARGVGHFRSRHPLARSRSWVSLRSEGAFNRTVTVPPVNDESLDRLLDYEAQQQVPYPLDEVFWDRRVLEIGEQGEARVSIYAIRKALVDDRLRKLAKMGLPVDGMQLRALALQNFCSFEGLFEAGTVVVDFDYASTNILIHDGTETWFMTLPMGGVDLVEAIREELGLQHKMAVRLARGEGKPADVEAYKALRLRVATELVEEIGSRTSFWFGTRPDVRPSSVVVFHSHPTVPPLQALLKRELGLPVFVPRGFRRLTVDPDVVTAGIQEQFPGLAKAVGLGLQGVGRAEVEAKLFPAGIERDLGRRRAGWVAAAILLLLLFLVGAWKAGGSAEELEAVRLEQDVAMGTGMLRSVALADSDLTEELAATRALQAAVGDLSGPLPLVDHLWRRLGAWTAGEPPRIVALDWSRGAEEAPRLVLATREGDGGAAEADRVLARFADSLKAGGGVREVTAGEGWSAGTILARPPASSGTDELLRRTYRHLSFTLELATDEEGPR